MSESVILPSVPEVFNVDTDKWEVKVHQRFQRRILLALLPLSCIQQSQRTSMRCKDTCRRIGHLSPSVHSSVAIPDNIQFIE